MRVLHGVLYLADLSPCMGSEPGKIRPVVVLQTDLLNQAGHPSTWILPCTSNLTGDNLLRVQLPAGLAGNKENCEVMIDQSRAIDNRRIKKELNPLPKSLLKEIKEKIRLLGDL
jgi:mRNA interferase MazF